METHEEKKEEAIQRSEEVQTIIDRMPTRGERTLAITFRCVVKEHNFDEANAKISILKKTCEEFEIISQEEL